MLASYVQELYLSPFIDNYIIFYWTWRYLVHNHRWTKQPLATQITYQPVSNSIQTLKAKSRPGSTVLWKNAKKKHKVYTSVSVTEDASSKVLAY